MQREVLEVTGVTFEIRKKNPPILAIISKGNVSSSGWTNGKLIPFEYKNDPPNGIFEFSFVADEPIDIHTQIISEITSEEFERDYDPLKVKGVKINALNNQIITIINGDKNKKTLTVENPLKKVSPETLEKLKTNNHDFYITNSFIWEDALHISVKYTGSKNHQFQLVWDGNIIKTLPPQIHLFLSHDNIGDNANETIEEELQFNLSSQITTETDLILSVSQKLNFKI